MLSFDTQIKAALCRCVPSGTTLLGCGGRKWRTIAVEGSGLEPVIDAGGSARLRMRSGSRGRGVCRARSHLQHRRDRCQEVHQQRPRAYGRMRPGTRCGSRKAGSTARPRHHRGRLGWIVDRSRVAEISRKLHIYSGWTEPTRALPESHVALKEARRFAIIVAGADGSTAPMCHPFAVAGSSHRKGEPRLAEISVPVNLFRDRAFARHARLG